MHGPVFSVEPPNTVVFANTKGASIACAAFGVPAPRLKWVRKDGSPVTEIPRVVSVLPNNTLYFPPFKSAMFHPDAHSQEYRCVATNKGGKILSRLLRVTAVVVDKDNTYNVQLNNVWVMRGGTAVLKCLINPHFVNEYIKVTEWTQGSVSITNNTRISVTSNGELQVRDVSDVDRTSAYRCVTKNILTLDEMTSPPAYIHVYDPPAVSKAPNIEKSLSSLTAEEDSKAELPCVATGNPLPRYEWSKGGQMYYAYLSFSYPLSPSLSLSLPLSLSLSLSPSLPLSLCVI
ncbi:DSCAM [Acanthosepion pharaonis]|uniref:DSCAM n=1 Tax=Acanthosepion pharaonis TaxID=158019 RepID=A0A812AVC3_ACAPH|nr:DSCAM [Sepia pharaonis]